MKYFDKNGTEIHAGMFLRMEDGSIEEVYTCGDGYDGVDLGINASNEEICVVSSLTNTIGSIIRSPISI